MESIPQSYSPDSVHPNNNQSITYEKFYFFA